MLQLKLPDPRGVVFFLHGNAGNLAGWFANADFYRRAGFDLVMPDYRGFGKSTGRIASAVQLRADVRAVWDACAAQYRGKRVVLYGRSLGTALAADLAEQLTRRRPRRRTSPCWSRRIPACAPSPPSTTLGAFGRSCAIRWTPRSHLPGLGGPRAAACMASATR